MKSIFLGWSLVLSVLGVVACGHATETPAASDIAKAMKARWEHPGTANSPKTVFTANSIKIGAGATANAQDKIDGIPPGAWVTVALVDFTVRSHYSNSIQAVRRVRECHVYRDQFDEWAVLTGRSRGPDETTNEPLPPQ